MSIIGGSLAIIIFLPANICTIHTCVVLYIFSIRLLYMNFFACLSQLDMHVYMQQSLDH